MNPTDKLRDRVAKVLDETSNLKHSGRIGHVNGTKIEWRRTMLSIWLDGVEPSLLSSEVRRACEWLEGYVQ